MHFRSGQCRFAWLMLLIATASPALGDELSLLNTAKPEIQQQIAAASPGFIADQKTAVRANYPLFIFVPGIIGSRLERTTPGGSKVLCDLPRREDRQEPVARLLEGS